METVDRRLIIGAAGLAGVAALSKLAQAGPLNPPAGPVAPTGKTVQELYDRIARTDAGLAEPRIPVQSLPGSGTALHVISQPGSYYLTGNIVGVAGKHGIEIAADHVTVDLVGFDLVGVPQSGNAIQFENRRCIDICGGTIAGWPGAAVFGDSSHYGSLTRLRINDCGSVSPNPWAVFVDDGWEASHCVISDCRNWGLRLRNSGRINNCAAFRNLGVGLHLDEDGAILDCVAALNSDGAIQVGKSGLIERCHSAANLYGIVAAYACRVANNVTLYNGIGIVGVRENSTFENNVVSFNSNAGMEIRQPRCTLRGNQATENGTGFNVTSTNCVVVGNRASTNATNYAIAAGNSHGPIVNVAGVGDISSIPGANHPWANFVY